MVYLFFAASRSVLGPTQPCIQWEAVEFSLVVKHPVAWNRSCICLARIVVIFCVFVVSYVYLLWTYVYLFYSYVYLLYLMCICCTSYVYLLYLMCICCTLCVFVVLLMCICCTLCVFVVLRMCICCTLCVFVVPYVYLLYLTCICCTMCVLLVLTLDAGLLARSQYPEGPATGHLDTDFSWFPVSTSECWDGSQFSKLLLHACHVALRT